MFKPGDQVRCIKTLPSFPIVIGDTYTVYENCTPFLNESQIKIIGFPGSFFSSRFELIGYPTLRSDYV